MDKERPILEEFFELAKIISATLDLDTLLRRIGWAAEKVTNAEASSIMLIDEDKQHLYFKTASGEKSGIVKKIRIKIGEGIAGMVAESKQSVIVDDAQSDPRVAKFVDLATGFTTRNILCVPMVLGNEVVGVVEVLNKRGSEKFNNEDLEILESLASLAAVAVSNAKYAEEQRNFFVHVIEILSTASETHDERFTGHTRRVAQYALAIGRQLGLSQREYQNLYYAALLHDIGFLSPGNKEMREVNHPVVGFDMLRGISLFAEVAAVIKYHHEYYDGSGIPGELKGGDIPFLSRILCLAEEFDEKRIHGISEEQILEDIKNNRYRKYDPLVVEKFLEIYPL
jgi:putative nucleotidyltransferase with HDIG domain